MVGLHSAFPAAVVSWEFADDVAAAAAAAVVVVARRAVVARDDKRVSYSGTAIALWRDSPLHWLAWMRTPL